MHAGCTVVVGSCRGLWNNWQFWT